MDASNVRRIRPEKAQPEWYMKYAAKEPGSMRFITKQNKEHLQGQPFVASARKKPTKVKDLVDNLTVPEVAEHLRCDLSYVYDLIRLQKLKCIPFGRRRVVPLTYLNQFLEDEEKRYYAKSNFTET